MIKLVDALERLRSWTWWQRCEESTDRAKIYEFLRWYTRLLTTSLGALVGSQRSQQRPGVLRVQHKLSTLCENTVVNLAFLEQRIEKHQRPFESIRLVKVE